jgi:hypothetical protein
MSVLEKARHLFQEAGLAFPTLPEELAVGLKEQGKWLFSTRELKMSPYNLQHYVHEGDEAPREYAILSHSGHGANSYAIQYYLVSGPLRMFLHLGWGGVYRDADADASKIRECFTLADEIVPVAMTSGKLAASELLTIVASDFYGSYWSAPGQRGQKEGRADRDPAEVLTEVLHWLKKPPPNQMFSDRGLAVGETVSALERRVRQFEHYLRLMEHRALRLRRADAFVIFSKPLTRAEKVQFPGRGRWVQFAFMADYFYMDQPDTALTVAEAHRLIAERPGFAFVLSDPAKGVAEYESTFDPVQRSYSYAELRAAAEDSAYIFFDLYGLSVETWLKVKAASFDGKRQWERGFSIG